MLVSSTTPVNSFHYICTFVESEFVLQVYDTTKVPNASKVRKTVKNISLKWEY